MEGAATSGLFLGPCKGLTKSGFCFSGFSFPSSPFVDLSEVFNSPCIFETFAGLLDFETSEAGDTELETSECLNEAGFCRPSIPDNLASLGGFFRLSDFGSAALLVAKGFGERFLLMCEGPMTDLGTRGPSTRGLGGVAFRTDGGLEFGGGLAGFGDCGVDTGGFMNGSFLGSGFGDCCLVEGLVLFETGFVAVVDT